MQLLVGQLPARPHDGKEEREETDARQDGDEDGRQLPFVPVLPRPEIVEKQQRTAEGIHHEEITLEVLPRSGIAGIQGVGSQYDGEQAEKRGNETVGMVAGTRLIVGTAYMEPSDHSKENA
jgi:hypothetical protein